MANIKRVATVVAGIVVALLVACWLFFNLVDITGGNAASRQFDKIFASGRRLEAAEAQAKMDGIYFHLLRTVTSPGLPPASYAVSGYAAPRRPIKHALVVYSIHFDVLAFVFVDADGRIEEVVYRGS